MAVRCCSAVTSGSCPLLLQQQGMQECAASPVLLQSAAAPPASRIAELTQPAVVGLGGTARAGPTRV